MGTRRRVRRGWWIGALLAIAATGGTAAWWQHPADNGGTEGGAKRPALAAATAAPAVLRRETRPTLDPARFVGKAARAHQVAREIPDTLDRLYCYCECDKHAGHKSLLSCYTDGHAAT